MRIKTLLFLLASTAVSLSATELIQNGDFQSPAFTGMGQGITFTDWVETGFGDANGSAASNLTPGGAYNRSHQRYGTLWAERFKSVLVEGQGNPLQTMAAYIDLNPVRAGLVDDPKDYRFCGYAEAVVGDAMARKGLSVVWSDFVADARKRVPPVEAVLQAHRSLIFGKRASESGLSEMSRKQALKVLDQEDGLLPKSAILRCRVRYFTDGAILGSEEFVRGFVGPWQMERRRKYPPKVNAMKGADWGDLAVIQGLRRQVFG